MSATASGSDARPSGSATNRGANDAGTSDRTWTPQQKAEVIRIRRCGKTSYYEILSIEKSATENEVKKAYRKISLLTHPDKNGYDGADEAFKRVSEAFQILMDADKRAIHDRTGGDPNDRFARAASGAGGASPFAGFQRAPGRGPMFEDEISPEELFNRFFGGGMGGGMNGGFPFAGGGFGGPQFVFNMGGGPGFTVHQMGGRTPRRRPRDGTEEAASGGLSALTQLLPLLLLFLLPLLSSLFSGSTPSGPSMRFDTAVPPHTMHRVTPKYNVDYYINPAEVDGWKARQMHALDQRAEVEFITGLRHHCENEVQRKQQEISDATGLFWTDEAKLRRAREMPMPNCRRLEGLKVTRQY